MNIADSDETYFPRREGNKLIMQHVDRLNPLCL